MNKTENNENETVTEEEPDEDPVKKSDEETFLARRERQFLLRLADGMEPREAAADMGISPDTCYVYLSRIRAKRERAERTVQMIDLLLPADYKGDSE